ncbi:Streptomycin 3''-adenylyltransferase [Pandoraea horticolens]|uniref:Aminoglycoside (3'') (9) adenylyltransferase n=1 Tax=Pandoraea horticolens TaxID=2508298 RepID=A0A5E4VRP2_9BURK|nr:aminoglycoside adenylyltransferase family protein [Pandoraea horticolens]VVE14166.1 Streptomycin 3''-adenylyltransferase [Pandoraea horticolens]
MTSLPIETLSQLSNVRIALQRFLAGNLRTIHLFGSAVDGGLKPNSDLDLMVSVSRPIAGAMREHIARELLAHSSPPGSAGLLRPLEVTIVALSELVPWEYPAMREMQFGEWLRTSIEEGYIEPPMVDHDLAILITKVRQQSETLYGPRAVDVFDPVPSADLQRSLLDTIALWNIGPDWEGDERNVILALARIWFTASTGAIASKDAAALWAMSRSPVEHRRVLARTLSSYLYGDQGKLTGNPTQMASFVRFCKAEIQCRLALGSAGSI